MKQPEVYLIEPCEDFNTEFLKMAAEFGSNGDDRYRPALQNFSEYLRIALEKRQGANLKPGRVPENEYLLIADGEIAARSKLRHYLNAALELEGGHIGYDVRPSKRRQGYGSRLLKLTLEKAKELGLSKVLLTCDADNVGSVKVIENNGGKLENELISEKGGKPIYRFWIEI